MKRIGQSIVFLSFFCMWFSTSLAAPNPLAFTSDKLGNIFTDTSAQVVLKITDPRPVLGGSITAEDETAVIRIKQEIAPGTKELRIVLPAKGFYKLKAEVRFDSSAVVTQSTTVAVVGSLIDDQLRLKSRIGIWSVHGDRSLALAGGSGWERVMTSLKDYPQSTITSTDEVSAPTTGTSPPFRMIGVLAFGLPLWMMDLPADFKQQGFAHPFQAPKDWDQLRKLTEAFARRPPWKWFPEYFEVYNEPDAVWKGSMEDLAKFHSVVAKAIKAVRPQTKVLGPCMCSILRIPYLDQLVRAGLLNDLDGLAMHPYVNGTPPEGEFIAKVIELKSYLASIGKKDFPIYFTEFGWTTGQRTWQPAVDELTQARYASRSLTLLAAQRIDCIMYFCQLFKNDSPGEAEFSILHQDSTPKPGYAAYANVARWLAGVEGGQWLRLSPTMNLALFDRSNYTVAVAWNTQGSSKLALPQPWVRVEDMMGRTLPIKDVRELELSPSPIFVEINDPAFAQVTLLKPVRLMGDATHALPQGWQQVMTPSPLELSTPNTTANQTIHVPVDAPTGHYLVLGKTNGQWQGLPVEVCSELNIVSAEIRWPLTETTPSLEVYTDCQPARSGNATAKLKLDIAQASVTRSADVPADGQLAFTIPLPELANGRRHRGMLALEASSTKGHVQRMPVDITLVPCLPMEGTVHWETLPWIDFSQWNPFMGIAAMPAPVAAEDCSARLKIGYNDAGIHMLVRVRDNQHQQNQPPDMMWQQDSIQFGFDVDAGQPWVANFGGFAGHRVFQYGVAKKNNEVMVWRWASYDPTLPANVSESRVQALVTREGDITQYTITLPWAVIGLKEKPQAGQVLGFALAVNDFDGKPDVRHGLRLFGGIVEDQDPKHMGKLWLR